MDAKTIRTIEAGRSTPRPSTVRRLADALALEGTDREEFFASAAPTSSAGDGAGRPPADPAAASPGTATLSAAELVPRLLPAPPQMFTGRVRQLAVLDAMRDASTVVISAIAGTAGIGKTALAVHWAHRVRDRFPDGQLYVNLRGFDPAGTIMMPGEAIRRFLDALNVPPHRIPADPGAQVDLYRTMLSGKRMLLVLDNVRDPDQVRPLLPGAPGCLVLVTSRNRLTGLIATDGAHPLPLDLLTRDEARDLLQRRLGPGRIAAEPDAADELITCCARLPLALAIVAAAAATHPQLPLAALAEQLRDGAGRLDALATGDSPATDLRAVFSWSYQALGREAARMFRLLGLHPGPEVSTEAAASLAAMPADQARSVLRQLTDAHLVNEHRRERYGFHDLLRAYAADLAVTVDSDEERRAATRRVLDHYLHTAYPAARLLDPARDTVALTTPQPGVVLKGLTTPEQALDWFTAEHRMLLAAVEHAATTGSDAQTWQLAWTLDTFLNWRGHWQDRVLVQHAAVAAAGRLADRPAQARSYRRLAQAYARLGRLDDAHTQLLRALDLYGGVGDLAGHADTHLSLAYVGERRGRVTEALDHCRQALELYRAGGDRRGLANSLNGIGWCYALLGDHGQALTFCQQALTLLQELGDRDGQAATWDSLGYAHHRLGEHAEAIVCFHNALELRRDLGDRYYEADTLTHLGDTHSVANNPQAARDAWQRALDILADLDHPDAAAVRAKLDGVDPTAAASTPAPDAAGA